MQQASEIILDEIVRVITALKSIDNIDHIATDHVMYVSKYEGVHLTPTPSRSEKNDGIMENYAKSAPAKVILLKSSSIYHLNIDTIFEKRTSNISSLDLRKSERLTREKL